MNKKLLLLLPALALLGQGCVIPGRTTDATRPVQVVEPLPDDAPICDARAPQVYFHAKATFTAAELAQINSDIVEPMATFFGGGVNGNAVAIIVKKQGTDLIVEAIVDQPGSDAPVYEGVLLRRLPTGEYEAWTPTDPGPGYGG